MSKNPNNTNQLLQQKYSLDEDYYRLIYRLVAIQCCVPEGLQDMMDAFVDIEIELLENGVQISEQHLHSMRSLIDDIAEQITKLEEERHGKRL